MIDMKLRNIFILFSSALMLLSSCEKNFDPQIYGSFTTENFPKTKADYISLAMTCYVPFTGVWSYKIGAERSVSMYFIEQGQQRYFDACTDEMHPYNADPMTGDFAYYANANFDIEKNRGRDYSGGHFHKIMDITRMTEIIGLIEKAPENVLDKATKEQLLGETRLCRGLHMYHLLHVYGPMPLILDPEKTADNEALFDFARPTLDEMSKWITDDFECAILYVPEKDNVSEKGRYTKDFARFNLMRHCLNEGYHMDGYYQRAIELYNEMNGKYSLFRGGVSNSYWEQFNSTNEFNCEVIMALSCTASANGTQENGNPVTMYTIPSDVHTDNSKNPALGTYMPGWSNPYYHVAKAFYDTFEDGDDRKATIQTSYVDRTGKTNDPSTIGSTWDGYIINKWRSEVAAQWQPIDYPIARWADVLLMYAEALTRKENAVKPEAVAAVNDVRNRVGLQGLSADKTNSVDSFLDAILIERGHELYFEGTRKIDLIRFNQYAQKTASVKGFPPASQYVPIPNYAIIQAKEHGVDLLQTYSRTGWEQDLAAVK